MVLLGGQSELQCDVIALKNIVKVDDILRSTGATYQCCSVKTIFGIQFCYFSPKMNQFRPKMANVLL